MKLRKGIVSVLAMLLLVSSLQLTAFAEEDHYYNFYADFANYNSDCVELANLKDVKDAKVTITKNDDPSITATLALEYDPDPEWQDMWGVDYQDTPEMRTIIADLAENDKKSMSKLSMKKALKASLKDNHAEIGKNLRTKTSSILYTDSIFDGYTVTVEGLGEHFTISGVYGAVTTAETIQARIEMIVEMIRSYGGSAYKDYVAPSTYSQLMEDLAKALDYESYADMLKDDEYTEKEIQDELEYLEEMDTILVDIANGTFTGQLDIYGDLECDCPEKMTYWIEHEYYKNIDGKRTLIMTKTDRDSAFEGTTVYAKDYLKPVLNGDNYTLTESLDSYTREPLSEFVVGGASDGLILCYDYDGDEDAGVTNTDDDDQQVKRKPEVVTGEDGPDTGDYTPMETYFVLLAIGLGGITAALSYRRKEK